ncbi:hypothetical protein HDU98_005628 [Podochytrium sp. JEL0797]|nr:hypothetical protein HDU98_005628 [Podochytrium sp. JEL0797]
MIHLVRKPSAHSLCSVLSGSSTESSESADESSSEEWRPRPRVLGHPLFDNHSPSLSESEHEQSLKDSDELSMVSKANSKFNEETWASAYIKNNSFALHSLPALTSLPLVLDWEDDEDSESPKHVPSASPESATENSIDEPTPAIPNRPKSPFLSNLANTNIKRFSDPHYSAGSSSSSIVAPRRTSMSVASSPVMALRTSPHTHYYANSHKGTKMQGMRRYSHAATCTSTESSNMDPDDRFIVTVRTRLKELDDRETDADQHQQTIRGHPEPPHHTNKQPSLLASFSFLGGTSPTSSTSTSSTNSPSSPLPTAALPLPILDTPPTVPPPQNRSSLVSFISRAFGPRRSLQHRNRPPASSATPSTGSPSLAPTDPQSQHRASMPHISWSSWSNSSRRSSRSSLSTLREMPLTSATGSSVTTKKETRTKLERGLQLFEMGATEAAFATFRDAAESALEGAGRGDTFAEFCVAVCMLYGYGCATEYEAGVEMLKGLKEKGEVLAGIELGFLEN